MKRALPDGRTAAALAALSSSLCALAISATPALAARSYDSQITGFGSPLGIAVDKSDQVWISDLTDGTVSEYGSYPSQTKIGEQNGAGEFAYGGRAIYSLAVSDANGYLYVGDSAYGIESLDVFDPESLVERWAGGGYEHVYVAADNSEGNSNGRIYVTSGGGIEAFDGGHHPIEFSASEAYITGNRITGTPAGEFGYYYSISLSVDSKGNLYVVDYHRSVVDEFAPSGELIREYTGAGAPHGFEGTIDGAAVDPTNGNLLVANGTLQVVDEFSSTGEFLGELATANGGPFGTLPGGIAVNSEGYLYVVDNSKHVVDVFSSRVVLPKITYESESGPTATSATVGATVDPNGGGDVTDCYVEYGTDTTYALGSVPCSPDPASNPPASNFTGPTPVTASLTELSTETTYHYRVVAANENGTRQGADQTLTPHFVNGLRTDAASGVVATAALLNASYVGNGEDTHYYFEWGPTTAYGNVSSSPPGADAGSPAGPGRTPESYALTGLTPATSYHFRVVASNGLGTSSGSDKVFTTQSAVEGLRVEKATGVRSASAQLNGSFVGNGEDTHYYFEWGPGRSYENTTPVPPGTDAGSPIGPGRTNLSVALTELTPSTEYSFRLVASNGNGSTTTRNRVFVTRPPVDGLNATPATNVAPTSATLNGIFDPDPLDTHYHFVYYWLQCYWTDLGNFEGCGGGGGGEAPPGGADAGIPSGPTPVSADVTGLEPAATYYFYIEASNSLGSSTSEQLTFKTPPLVPVAREPSTLEATADVATVSAEVNPGQGPATSINEPGQEHSQYFFEYGTVPCAANPGQCSTTLGQPLKVGTEFQKVTGRLPSLQPGTKYFWRPGGKNQTGTGYGPELSFTTYPKLDLLNDLCSNSHVRQQSGSATLPDCRAYELVSASDTAGYDVESNLVPGETPYGGYPGAENPPRVLYSVHDGGIPGTDHPTNRGLDPYVATRGQGGWSTEYVGIPADNPFASSPFSSIPSGFSSSLETGAFGGPDGCSPCFKGGYTGIPVRLADGQIVQGMAGPIDPGPATKPDGYVAKDLSANGEHFIFGSVSRFAEGGNSGGDVSIYDRNLSSGQTHVVSNTSDGEDFPEALPCLQGAGKCNAENEDSNGISELDISANGSHILLGQKVSTDIAGNVYWHLYMNVGDSIRTIDLTPGTTTGVLYDGMTEDGSRAFFTTVDKLTGEDKDGSADIYRGDISGGGATLHLVSSGTEGAGNSDACDPVSNENGEHWNTVGSSKSCGVAAIGGGGGVAAKAGAIYFFSPEKLSGAAKGTENQPNLYLESPGSASPQFVASLEPEDSAVQDAVKESEVRKTGDFQVTPDGSVSVFPTTRKLNEVENLNHQEIYRYEVSPGELACISCIATELAVKGDSSLASNGLSLTDDGRVFFTADEPLVGFDSDNRRDVYEWEAQGTVVGEGAYSCQTAGGCVGLISSGLSQFDFGLLSASADGKNAYFFSRESLTHESSSGNLTKIYDARELGGFPFTPPAVPCKASDECHGAGSPIPPQPAIESGAGVGGNESHLRRKCRSGYVRRHGHCVKKHHGHKHHNGGGK